MCNAIFLAVALVVGVLTLTIVRVVRNTAPNAQSLCDAWEAIDKEPGPGTTTNDNRPQRPVCVW